MSDVEASGPNSKLLLVAGLIVGVAVGGGVTFAMFGNAAPPPAEEVAEGEEKPLEKKTEIGDLLTANMDRIAVPIYGVVRGRQKFLGNYFIDIVVQTENESKQITVRQNEPRLRHAFVDAISKPGLMQKENPLQIDIKAARKVFKKLADDILGDDVIYDLSIVSTVRVSG